MNYPCFLILGSCKNSINTIQLLYSLAEVKQMDYRHYRGEPLFKLPKNMGRYVHLLRFFGTAMLVFAASMPMLMLLHIIESTFFWNFLTVGLVAVGTILTIIGVIWNTRIDRAE